MVFPIVIYGCESWTIKKAEHQIIDAFALWCWRRLLRVPWTARRSNQSILKEINPQYSLEGLMLKLQYFGHLMQRVNSLENTLMLGKTETEDWNGWMASPTQWIWVWANSRRQWRTGKPGVLQSMASRRVRHDLATEQQLFDSRSFVSGMRHLRGCGPRAQLLHPHSGCLSGPNSDLLRSAGQATFPLWASCQVFHSRASSPTTP